MTAVGAGEISSAGLSHMTFEVGGARPDVASFGFLNVTKARASQRPIRYIVLLSRPKQMLSFSLSNYSRSTVTGASPEMPSAWAAAGVTSMMRPRTNGPRSLMVTTTERPLL